MATAPSILCAFSGPPSIAEAINQFAMSFALTPTHNVRVLIQLAYEPVPEFPSTSWFGSSGYRRLGLLSYIREIYRRDGLSGIYTGAATWGLLGACKYMLHCHIKQTVRKALNAPTPKPLKPKEYPSNALLAKEIAVETIAACATTLLLHPLTVLANRSVAQLVGHESLYSYNVFSGLYSLYEDGDLFNGLVPSLCFVVVSTAAISVAEVILNGLLPEAETIMPSEQDLPSPQRDQLLTQWKTIRRMFVAMGAKTITHMSYYPFTLVSTMMTVNGSRLEAGKPPVTPVFADWTDCWNHNYQYGNMTPRGLLRGSANLFRFYKTPAPRYCL